MTANEFCQRLTALPEECAAKCVYRLPTEAQWECACCAGTTTRWWCGDDETALLDCAWLNSNAGGITHPVGEKRPNPWGLCDVHGHVEQWCLDWFDAKYYELSSAIDPMGPPSGSNRVLRGGGWGYVPVYCRSAYRHSHRPGGRNRNAGLRVCLVLAE